MDGQNSKSEKIITESVITFINKHIRSGHLDSLDEIVLSYIVTVLENLATESSTDLSDSFDVEEFCEMLSAYFPEFTNIPQTTVSEWIFELVSSLKKSTEKGKATREDIAFESLLGEIDCEPRAKRFSESSSDGSSCNGSKKSSSSRTPRVSETSDSETEVVDIIERLQMEEKVQTLLEMFPTLPRIEAMNFVALSNGDLEKSVQMVLLVMETGSLHLNGAACLSSKTKLGLGAKSEVDEKVLKDRVVQRYGFIDQAEDSKEFRPAPPKVEPKKLVRYRDNQVVSTKGERYSEVRCRDGEEVRKNYISKPHKQMN